MKSQISIREATKADIPRLIEMGKDMRDEAEMLFPAVDAEWATRCAERLIEHDDGLILVAEGDVIRGMLVASRTPTIWSPQYVASETLLYIEKKYRNFRLLKDFLDRFEDWAGDVFAVDVSVWTGRDISKVMNALGYKSAGANFKKVK